MEPKKSQKANLDRFRVVSFQTGLVVSLLFAITLLSWNFKIEAAKELNPNSWKNIPVDELPPVTIKKPEEIKPPSPIKKKPENIIKIVDDNTEVEQPKKEELPEITELTKTGELPTGEPDPRISADRMPASPGCMHLDENLLRIKCTEEFIIRKVYNYLKNKNTDKVSGKVYVYFVINQYGKVADVKIMQGLNPLLDNEVLKAVYSLGEFEPAIHEGLPATIRYTLPVDFKVK